jgi:hypothetical protein
LLKLGLAWMMLFGAASLGSPRDAYRRAAWRSCDLVAPDVEAFGRATYAPDKPRRMTHVEREHVGRPRFAMSALAIFTMGAMIGNRVWIPLGPHVPDERWTATARALAGAGFVTGETP